MRFGIGIQSFKLLREEGYVYVDKTEQIARFMDAAPRAFLSRPRRFGKSTTLSTIVEMHSDRRDLFEGLWAYDNWDFAEKRRPVVWLRFGMGGFGVGDPERSIRDVIDYAAKDLGLSLEAESNPARLVELVTAAARQSPNGRAVILVDEYDKPVVDYLDDLPTAEANLKLLRALYTSFKDLDPAIDYLLLTGVSALSKVSLFSGLNNLRDQSLAPSAQTVVGVTEAEIDRYFAKVIDAGPNTREDVRRWYNGYSWGGDTRVYNPWSLTSYISDQRLKNYWITTGTPMALFLKLRGGFRPPQVPVISSEVKLTNLKIEDVRLVPLLFQTGYLTITGTSGRKYELDYPNLEVRETMEEAFLSVLIDGEEPIDHRERITAAIESADFPELFMALNALFAEVPYHLWGPEGAETERIFHAVTYLVFRLADIDVRAEVATAKGRADAVVHADTHVIGFEFKLDGSADDALAQVKGRDYLGAHAGSGKTVVAVGANFSSETRGVDDYRVEELV